MMKYEDELSLIKQRINSIPMTNSKRRVALAALRDAAIVVDACAGLARKLGQIRAVLSLKPSLGTKAHG